MNLTHSESQTTSATDSGDNVLKTNQCSKLGKGDQKNSPSSTIFTLFGTHNKMFVTTNFNHVKLHKIELRTN